MKQEEFDSFGLRYGGEPDNINALTFVKSLSAINTIVEEINIQLNKLNDTDNRVEIRVKAFNKGSFLVFLDLIETALNSLDTGILFSIACGIVPAISKLFNLITFLEGKEPQDVQIQNNNEKIIIINHLGDKETFDIDIYNLFYNNPAIQNPIRANFETLYNDKKIETFKIYNKKNELIYKSNRDEFQKLSMDIEYEDDKTREIRELAILHLSKANFEKKYVWGFYYKGQKISAYIKDDLFYNLIDKGEKFAKGDILQVEMIIHQEFDEVVNTYINKKCIIERIIKHIPRTEQEKLQI